MAGNIGVNAMPAGKVPAVQAPIAQAASTGEMPVRSTADAAQWLTDFAQPASAALSDAMAHVQPDGLQEQALSTADAEMAQILAMQWHPGMSPLESAPSVSVFVAATPAPDVQTPHQDVLQQEVDALPAMRSAALPYLHANTAALANNAELVATSVETVGEAASQILHFSAQRSAAVSEAPNMQGQAAAPSVSVRQAPQALVQALAQRIQVQQAQGMDIATVRLDPPEMGALEIRIRQDANGVHVQMHASNAEVGRQLASVAEGLRSELQQRTQEATVTVANSRFGQPGEQKQRHSHSQEQFQPEQPVIGQALQG